MIMIQKRINEIKQRLLAVVQDPDQAAYEAWLLLEKATGLSRVALLTSCKNILPEQQVRLDELLHERIDLKKPLAYVLGTVFFSDLELFVQPPILIPRPETEQMVEWITEKFKNRANDSLLVFDLCTGSGCIALALAARFPAWRVIGVDNNPQAISLAEKNKASLGILNAAFIQASIFDDDWLLECNLIVSNPPYVSKLSEHLVSTDALAWEDHNALFAANGGWVFYDRLLELAKKVVRPHADLPSVVFEFGVDQQEMREYLIKNGFSKAFECKDMAGISRWAGG